jgi:hypothetical protein
MTDWMERASPVLVIGMHRSGTRLLAQALESLGMFMGADLQADAESMTFIVINEGLLHQCGAFWSEPMSAHFTLAQDGFAQHLAESAREALAARLPHYCGDAHGFDIAAAGARFGWKDPRNTFTLPVWLQVFPRLRVVHLLRHGVDVADSLARRHAAALRAATGEAVPSALTVIRDQGLGVLSSRRGWDLPEAFTMWEQYVEKARSEMAALGERAFEVRFEDLVGSPHEVASALARFCELPDPPSSPLRPLGDRVLAYRRDPRLASFALEVGERLRRYGYDA